MKKNRGTREKNVSLIRRRREREKERKRRKARLCDGLGFDLLLKLGGGSRRT